MAVREDRDSCCHFSVKLDKFVKLEGSCKSLEVPEHLWIDSTLLTQCA